MEIESSFSNQELYGDSVKVQGAMQKHHQLKAEIARLNEEWEKLAGEGEKT
jgi:hypothetical protein